METAAAIDEELGLGVEVCEPIYELRESDDYLALAPEEQKLRRWSNWMSEHGADPDYAPDGAESFNQVVGRVRRFKQLLEGGDPEGTVAAVTHGIFSRFFFFDSLLGERFGAADVKRLWQLRTANGALSRFEHGERHHAADPKIEDWVCVSWMERPSDPA